MQTDILLKQLNSTLAELKVVIDKFEKHPSPSTQYAEQLHVAIQNCNKMVSAYLVLKEQKDVSPELNLHLKLMNVPTPEEKKAIIEPIKEQVIVEQIAIAKEIVELVDVEPVPEKSVSPVIKVSQEAKELPNIAVNINDKFRFINELFDANVNEYNIAIEQINSVNSKDEMDNYLKGLKSIYGWNDDNEVVKTLYSLAQKRFS